MFGNIIKLVFKSFADNSGISKWNDSVKNSIGNMGQISRAAQALGMTMGGVGGAIGRLVGALAQGSVWGFAAQGIMALVDKWREHNEKVEEAKRKHEEAEAAARKSYGAINDIAAKAIENVNKELQARKAMADVIDRQYKAELQLRRAEALRSGDLAKAQNIEAAMADADRKGAVDRAEADAAAAEKRVAAAKSALDAAQKQAREAANREMAAWKSAKAAKPRTVETIMQSSAGAYVQTRKIGSDEQYKAAIKAAESARDSSDAADEAVDKAKAVYDIEVEKWKVARENAKAVAKEQEAAAEREFAERAAAEKKAADERNKAERKRLTEMHKKALEEKKANAKKDEEELAKERIKFEQDLLKKRQDFHTAAANDLRDKLKKAQDDAAAAFAQFRAPDEIDQKAERRAKRQEEIDKDKLITDAINLRQRKDWRTARLSNRDEAARRWLLAKENEGKVKTEQKEVVAKLDQIKTLLEAVSTL